MKEVKKHENFRQNIIKRTTPVLTLLSAIVTSKGQTYLKHIYQEILFLLRTTNVSTYLTGRSHFSSRNELWEVFEVSEWYGNFPLQSLSSIPDRKKFRNDSKIIIQLIAVKCFMWEFSEQ